MMSEMFKKIEDAVKEAMKAHDNVKRDCLRAVISDIKNLTVNAGKEITDDVCLKSLQKAVKTHNDSIEQFTFARREDLASKEKTELDVISAFLPKMLSDDEVEALVKDTIVCLEKQNNRPLAKKDMGMVMKALSSSANVASINMKVASKIVASML